MAEWGYRTAARRLASGEQSPEWVERLLRFIDSREDLSDHRLLVVLKLRLSGGDLLPTALRDRIDRTLLDFRYSFSEPGSDSMCTWTENHQLLFAVGEHLSGTLLADHEFANSGRTGAQKAADSRRRLMIWLEQRFRYGFSEWLSNTYYELDICALTMLIDHADTELAQRATMVLDLMMLDLALHRFDGHFVASSGRAYKRQKTDPHQAEIRPILQAAFGVPPAFEPDQVSSLFIARESYQIPDPIMSIARAGGAHRIASSHGRTVDETIEQALDLPHADRAQRDDDLLRALWSMQALIHDRSIAASMDGLRRYQLQGNDFFSMMSKFQAVRSGPVQRGLLRALNPVTQGMVLDRVNVLTYRTPRYLLSSAQSWRPGGFGDQQSVWIASLPGGVSVFSTHPGSTGREGNGRPQTPSAWIGNGINPDVGQIDNVVLVLHDLRSRSGFMEGRRHQLSHLYFPLVGFDDTRIADRMVVARRGDSYVGVRSLERLELVSDIELLQRGSLTAWGVVLSDVSEFSDLDHFAAALRDFELTHHRGVLRMVGRHSLGNEPVPSRHDYRLHWQHGFTVDRELQSTCYPRYDTDWIQMPRGALTARITAAGTTLELDWTSGHRKVTPAVLPRRTDAAG